MVFGSFSKTPDGSGGNILFNWICSGEIMNEQCKFINSKGYRCGSYAFNLYKEQIYQGDRCDHHYWQDRAVKAAAHEREACCAIVYGLCESDNVAQLTVDAIRARGTT